MPKKTKAKNENTTKQQQTKMQGEAFQRPNRVKEVDEAAEAYRKARDKRQAATKVETEKKTILKETLKRHGVTGPYFYDDEDGDTEEVKPTIETKEDVKVNKVKQAKAKADE
jgi:collagenase-like PrtC family protease